MYNILNVHCTIDNRHIYTFLFLFFMKYKFSFFFRFLSCCKITKPQLQLAAAVCLYISFKMNSLDVSSVEIAEFTDNCYSTREIISWELLVIMKLNWQLRSVTPLSLVNLVIQQAGQPDLRGHLTDMVLMSAGDPTLTFADPEQVTFAALELVIEESRMNKVLHRRTKRSSKTPETLHRPHLDQIKNQLRSLLQEDADSGYDSSRCSDISVKDIENTLDFTILKNYTSNSVVTTL